MKKDLKKLRKLLFDLRKDHWLDLDKNGKEKTATTKEDFYVLGRRHGLDEAISVLDVINEK